MEDKKVRNFYEEEAEYEKSILLAKEIVNKVVFVNTEELSKKIEIVDQEGVYSDYIYLLLAVIGRKTNKYYYCDNEEDVKYHGLELGKVYKMSEIGIDLQAKYANEIVLGLEARGILAEILLLQTKKLIELFRQNIKKGDGSFATIEQFMIVEKDIEYLEELLKYLELMIEKSGRLKVLVAERDIYALENANEQYEKKTGVEKLFHKIFNTKKSVIDDMINKYKSK